jgi:hypothetical protein
VTMKLYVNGVLDTTKAISFTIASNNLPLSIGAESSGARKFTGQMDEARVYNYALSASEIQALVTGTHTIMASTAGSGSGTITPSGVVSVNDGGSQSFTIAANSGNHIDSVVTDGINRGAVTGYTFTGVTANHTITAYFSPDILNHTITATAGANGSISPSGAVSVADGGSQAFTITPSARYHIDSVIVNGSYRGNDVGLHFHKREGRFDDPCDVRHKYLHTEYHGRGKRKYRESSRPADI